MFSIHVCNIIFHSVNVQLRNSTIVVVTIEYTTLYIRLAFVKKLPRLLVMC
jgi:hypothetical protein